jgi:hypothetical protein
VHENDLICSVERENQELVSKFDRTIVDLDVTHDYKREKSIFIQVFIMLKHMQLALYNNVGCVFVCELCNCIYDSKEKEKRCVYYNYFVLFFFYQSMFDGSSSSSESSSEEDSCCFDL